MSDFDVQDELIKEDDVEKGLTMKAYSATYRHQDTSMTTKYFHGETLLEAAEKATKLVEHDPFNTLIEVKELGPLR